ncbi:hypothetical protein LGT39_04960 [Demequina sp. TTPB684]|uniref:lanthionine synthetase LanC family protein n=1 Tax=Demequina sp. TTPB684 TaxID=2881057 RepID=UPI001CF48E6F|nr:hypothetical protein [Demequina sp. TTPB684]
MSYENGASGVLLLAHLLDDREAVLEYTQWIEDRLPTALNHRLPGAQSALVGADVAAHLAAPDSGLAHLAGRIRGLLQRKADSEIVALESATRRGIGSPAFWTSDTLTGLGRSLVILANSNDQDSSERLSRGAEVLGALLDPDENGMVGRVQGPPFFGREGDRIESHWNLGFAHGATGTAFALVRVGEFLRREQRPTTGVEASLRTYYEWLHTWFEDLSIPMYGHTQENAVEFVWNGGVPSWCYGTTGHALLMFAVGSFLEDSAIVDHGIELALLSAERIDSLADNSLCHGVAGVLGVLTSGRSVSNDSRLEEAESLVRNRVIASFKPQSLYGFDYTPPGISTPASVPGLLNGAAGIAIAVWQSQHGASEVDGAPWLGAPQSLRD